MISVLCPSRGRPEMLRDSLASLGSGDYEYLIWLDDDDPTIGRYLAMFPTEKVYVKPRVGYKQFHTMINFLSEEARGNWLMLWNDDGLIESGDLSEVIHSQSAAKPVVLNFFDPEISNRNLFPVISRPMYRAMGHFSLSTHCDSWVQDIANVLRIHKPIEGITARHLRETISDDTKADSQGAYAETSPEYDSDKMKSLRIIDQKKVKELL